MIMHKGNLNWVLMIVVWMATACDNGTAPVNDDQNEEPAPTHELSTIKSRLLMDNGRFEGSVGYTVPAAFTIFSPVLSVGHSSIWIYTETDQPRVVLSNYGPVLSNLSLRSPVTGVDPGMYSITADSIEDEITNWPAELGAPSTPDGQPRLFGDRMIWGHFMPFQSDSNPDAPPALTDIHVGISVYMFDDPSEQNLMFVRYDLTNRGNTSHNNVNVGYFADIDIEWLDPDLCPQWTHNDNATAYDETLGMSYTYQSPNSPDAAGVDPSCLGMAAGYLFLDGPVDPMSPNAHLAIRRWSKDEPTGLYEGSFTEALHFGRLLQGKTIFDEPIIDPTTNTETRYAFSGDPLAGTGWIEDEPQDVKSLLSLKPFSLAPGETKSLTIAWIVIEGQPDFESAIEALRSQAQTIRANPSKYLD